MTIVDKRKYLCSHLFMQTFLQFSLAISFVELQWYLNHPAGMKKTSPRNKTSLSYCSAGALVVFFSLIFQLGKISLFIFSTVYLANLKTEPNQCRYVLHERINRNHCRNQTTWKLVLSRHKSWHNSINNFWTDFIQNQVFNSDCQENAGTELILDWVMFYVKLI